MNSMVTKFATALLKIRMYLKFLLRLALIILILQVVIIWGYNSWFNHQWADTKYLISYGWDLAWNQFSDFEISKWLDTLSKTWSIFFDDQKRVVLSSFSVWLIIPWLISWMHLESKQVDNSRKFIQGRQFIQPRELNKLILKGCNKLQTLPLGDVWLPFKEENKQTFAVGKPGCGKTNTFNHLITKMMELNRKVLIHDYKGDYVEKFYNPLRDIIFNPLDSRCVGWTLFNDCQTLMDIDGFGAALIPQPTTGDPYWNNAARDVFIAILRYCWHNNLKTNKDIWVIATKSNEELYAMFYETLGCRVAAKHLEDPQGKTAIGVMSNMMQYIKIFEYMQDIDGDYSIRSWLTNNDYGIIFVTNYARLQNTLRPIISLFIQTAGSNLLSLTDDINRRVYMILDEFGQLPNMTTIESLMTAARSKGGAIFIGVQDIGQLDKIYKKETRTTILNSASNRLVFNCKDRDTAEFFSKDIGETEYWELNESQSLGMHKNDRVNSTRQRHKEFLVKPEDIQQLQDLSAYISIGHNEVTLSKWNYLVLDSINQAFTQRSNLNLDVVVDVVPNSSPTLEETIKNTKQSDIDLMRTNKYQVEPNNDNLLEQQIAGIYNSDEEIYSENPRKNPEQIDIHENWN